jgi:hypothetical protein
VIEEYRVLEGGVLGAMDGLWYFSSEKIGCEHCLTAKKKDAKGKEHRINFHAGVAVALVKPGSNKVLPLAPEIIRNEDGKEKQDCEHSAGKRWLEKHGEEYSWLKITLLGDDLYSDVPFCGKVLENGMSFIFTCKGETHKWLRETVENSYMRVITDKKWNPRKKKHDIHTWKYLNKVPLRYDERNPFLVNYLEYEIRTEGADKPTYHNSWVTDKEITDYNATYLAECGRTRWKIENEHNNVLKNRGYNLEHNFGHGKEHASEIFCMLNLLALMFHTILNLADSDYRQARIKAGRRDALFQKFRLAFEWFLFNNWQHFIHFILHGTPDEG